MRRAESCVVVCGLLLLFVVGCQQPLRVGSSAPDFSGVTDEGKTVKLNDLMGEKGVVVYFYPKDETPGCITEACAFRDRLGKLHAKGYTVVGISSDSVDSHKAFKAHHRLPFTLIADTDGAIAGKFGVPMAQKTLGGKPSLLIERQTFIIDKSGQVTERFAVKDPEEHVRKTFDKLGVPFN